MISEAKTHYNPCLGLCTTFPFYKMGPGLGPYVVREKEDFREILQLGIHENRLFQKVQVRLSLGHTYWTCLTYVVMTYANNTSHQRESFRTSNFPQESSPETWT